MPTKINTVVTDSTGARAFDPDSCSHTYQWNTDGTMTSDTATDGVYVYVKTYTYSGGNLVAESDWVLQQ